MDEGNTAIEACGQPGINAIFTPNPLTINFTEGYTDTFLTLDASDYYGGRLQFNFTDFELRPDAPGAFNWDFEGSTFGDANNSYGDAGAVLPYDTPYNPDNANTLDVTTNDAAEDYMDLDDDVMYVFEDSTFTSSDRAITDPADTQDVANYLNYFFDTTESDISDGGSGISMGESAVFVINNSEENEWNAYVYTETNDNGRIDAAELTWFMCAEGTVTAEDLVPAPPP
jgi:hypothetical protein